MIEYSSGYSSSISPSPIVPLAAPASVTSTTNLSHPSSTNAANSEVLRINSNQFSIQTEMMMMLTESFLNYLMVGNTWIVYIFMLLLLLLASEELPAQIWFYAVKCTAKAWTIFIPNLRCMVCSFRISLSRYAKPG